MSRLGRSLAMLTVLVAASLAAADTPAPEPVHSEIARLTAITLEKGHYSKRSLDDEVSRAWLDEYLDTLDYSRIYFVDDDIETFHARWSTRLDDDVLSATPTLTAAYEIHDLYRRRVQERVAFALKTLEQPFSFDDPAATVDVDRHEDPWADSPAALDTLWRARLAEQLLRMELSGDDRKTALERLGRRYARIQHELEELEAADVLEMYLGAMARVFDPHSVWFKPASKEDFEIDMADTLTGIGAELRQEDGYTTITKLIPGGPAKESGELEEQDKIVAVAQGDGEPEDVIDMRLDKVVRLIRGPIDTQVVLTIQPGDATDPAERRQVRLVRKKVKLDRAAAKGEVRTVDGTRVGVIDIPSFYRDPECRRTGGDCGATTRDTKKILEGFRAEGVDVVVVDLRRNGGGRLDEALDLTGLFLGDVPVVQIRSRSGDVDVLRPATSTTPTWTGPLVVLTSEVSASASEIFAAAIQDHHRGLIVGSERTHGKGTVQDLQDFNAWFAQRKLTAYADRGGALKYTTHMFFRPSGGSTQDLGVQADIQLPSPWAGMKIRERDLDHALPWSKVKPASYAAEKLPIDLEDLRRSSAKRVAQSMEFAFLKEDLNERARDEEDDTLSLHLPTRKAEIDRAKAIEQARETARKAAGWDGETELDPILDEAAHIAHDLVEQLRG